MVNQYIEQYGHKYAGMWLVKQPKEALIHLLAGCCNAAQLHVSIEAKLTNPLSASATNRGCTRPVKVQLPRPRVMWSISSRGPPER